MAHNDDESPTLDDGTTTSVMGLLSDHVPLSLIVDLSDPKGPDSEEILTSEGVPQDSWWVQAGAGTADEDADREVDEEGEV